MFSPVSPDGPPARAYAVVRRTRRRGGAVRLRLLRQRGDELIPDRYVRRGLASWYGDAFDGKPTASGEPFDSTQVTTAHYDLPFDSRVRVHNLNNDREVELRVTDRVPLEALNNGRLLDVSYAAARQLEMVEDGVVPIEVTVFVLDSTGLSIVGAGEWAAAKHGGCGRRGWRKLHLGVDQSGVIRVHTLTEATGDDATTALDLLTVVDGPLVRVTADAAYDTVAVYETAGARGARVVVPPARTANVSGHGPRSPARDRTITLVKQLGRRRWKKVSGYHRQGRVENTFFRYKSIIGDGLRARSSAGQGSEAVLGCEILNRMTALGRPVSYRIGR